jgi:hypothetical protein
MAKPSEVLVWINDDGSAREITDAEKKYVDAEFSPFDGARPYIKSYYEQRNGWGKLSGYLQSTKLPKGMPINPAPLRATRRKQRRQWRSRFSNQSGKTGPIDRQRWPVLCRLSKGQAQHP